MITIRRGWAILEVDPDVVDNYVRAGWVVDETAPAAEPEPKRRSRRAPSKPKG